MSLTMLALLAAVSVPPDTVPLYDDLGTHSYPITVTTPRVQAYFDQGLRLYWAFNHAEAIRAFREAQRLDPACAMCWWGEALALGPNINLPMDSASGAAAQAAMDRALGIPGRTSKREQAMIRALADRYASSLPADRARLDSAYADAMLDVVLQFPTDNEAKVLYAEAVMVLRPWNYWTADGLPREGIAPILHSLEEVQAADPRHPGACHLYIHAVEAKYPERAVACAERLADLMPGAGHLVHMPGHIYIRVGRYLDAIRANEHAVHADEAYLADQRPGVGMYSAGYYPHNYDFLAFAAAMAGRERQAIRAADKLAELAALHSHDAGMEFTQHHLTRALQLRVRFGRWDEILASPPSSIDLTHATAMWRYAHGRASAALGRVADAELDLEALREAVKRHERRDIRLEFNNASAVLQVAAAVLAGHVAAARGDFDAAVRELTIAAQHEDSLSYGEPPDWSIPVRQDLGWMLIRAERFVEAEQAFRGDLERFPRNEWSLHGLAEALKHQERSVEADPAA